MTKIKCIEDFSNYCWNMDIYHEIDKKFGINVFNYNFLQTGKEIDINKIVFLTSEKELRETQTKIGWTYFYPHIR